MFIVPLKFKLLCPVTQLVIGEKLFCSHGMLEIRFGPRFL